MKERKDFYAVLGVKLDATAEEIKKAYRNYAFIYHPDRMVHATDSVKKKANEKMKEINEAYEVLGRADKRQEYDAKIAKPKPRVEPPTIFVDDATPGVASFGSFIVYNDGGSPVKINIDKPPSWIKLISFKSLVSEGLPMQIGIKMEGQDWDTTYEEVLKVQLDGEETGVVVRLKTKKQSAHPNPFTQSTSPGTQTGRNNTNPTLTPPINQTPNSSSQSSHGFITFFLIVMAIFIIVILVNTLSEKRPEDDVTIVNEQTTVEQGIVEGNKNELELMSGNANLFIEALDGEATIAEIKGIFTFISEDFSQGELNKSGIATTETPVDVYGRYGAITPIKMFTFLSNDLDKLVMTQAQIIMFCKKYRDWILQADTNQPYGTYFLMKAEKGYLVASISRGEGFLTVSVFSLEKEGALGPFIRLVCPRIVQ